MFNKSYLCAYLYIFLKFSYIMHTVSDAEMQLQEPIMLKMIMLCFSAGVRLVSKYFPSQWNASLSVLNSIFILIWKIETTNCDLIHTCRKPFIPVEHWSSHFSVLFSAIRHIYFTNFNYFFHFAGYICMSKRFWL